MITETRFAASHPAFWANLLPMSEPYIRNTNAELGRFGRPLASRNDPQARGVVNELATRLFARAVATRQRTASLPVAAVETAIGEAMAHIERLRARSRAPLRRPEAEDVTEARALSGRLEAFFRKAAPRSLTVFPEFPGCGWLSGCVGDVMGDDILFEVKAGERGFRSIDLRQVLAYCALNFEAKRYDIRSVCLVNPREGTYVQEKLRDLCYAMAGRSAVEVLSEIVEYVSEALDRRPES